MSDNKAKKKNAKKKAKKQAAKAGGSDAPKETTPKETPKETTPKEETPSKGKDVKADKTEKSGPKVNPVFKYLHGLKLVDIVEKDQKVLTLNASDPVEKAVKVLTEHNLLSAPVIEDGKNIGFVDVLDIASFVVACSPDPQLLAKQELETLKIAGRAISLVPVKRVVALSGRDPQLPLYYENPASEAATLFAKGVHRVTLFNKDNEISKIVSQVDVAKAVLKELPKGALKEMGAKKLKDYGYGESQIFSVTDTSTVLNALQKIAITRVSAVAVVDAKSGALVGNFSASDLRGLYREKFPKLLQTVREFLEEHSPKSLTPICADVNASLLTNLKTIVEEGIHHLWVLDGDKKPLGIFSLTDVNSIFVNTQ